MSAMKIILWFLIYEAFIINIALIDLSRMGHYIFFALLGPLIFFWGYGRIHQRNATRGWIIASVIYVIIATVLSFIIPPILL